MSGIDKGLKKEYISKSKYWAVCWEIVETPMFQVSARQGEAVQ